MKINITNINHKDAHFFTGINCFTFPKMHFLNAYFVILLVLKIPSLNCMGNDFYRLENKELSIFQMKFNPLKQLYVCLHHESFNHDEIIHV